jgi:hypothetical protein
LENNKDQEHENAGAGEMPWSLERISGRKRMQLDTGAGKENKELGGVQQDFNSLLEEEANIVEASRIPSTAIIDSSDRDVLECSFLPPNLTRVSQPLVEFSITSLSNSTPFEANRKKNLQTKPMQRGALTSP